MVWLLLSASSSYDAGASVGDKIHPFFWPVVAIIVLFFLGRWMLRRRKG